MSIHGILILYITTRHLFNQESCHEKRAELKLKVEEAKQRALTYFSVEQLEEAYKDHVLNMQIQSSLERNYEVKWDTIIKIDYQGQGAASKLEVLKALRETLDMLIEEYADGDEKIQGLKIEESIQ